MDKMPHGDPAGGPGHRAPAPTASPARTARPTRPRPNGSAPNGAAVSGSLPSGANPNSAAPSRTADDGGAPGGTAPSRTASGRTASLGAVPLTKPRVIAATGAPPRPLVRANATPLADLEDTTPTTAAPLTTHVTPATSFAAVFREALRQRGLPLERVRERLETRGIRISLATLSYWQRGRSQPERAQSLRAVDALEDILALPTGALRSLLGPHRPRGRAVCELQDLSASQRVFGENSTVEQALGAAFAHFNEDLCSVVIRETLRLDERRCIRSTSVHQVLRATRDGASRLTVVHCIDDTSAESIDVVVRCGKPGSVRFLPELRCIIIEVLLGRELARNETAVIDYEVLLGPSNVPSTHHERRTRVHLREYLLHVYFHPDALPAGCHRYYREQIGAEKRNSRRIALDVSHSAHMLPIRCPAGVHGMSWEWPTD
ncbi:XRE family transcriptional regulator [Streptomyces buecherae]|uniref:XRE family transcriptional regulator n=2 Tax=Streptomyces buecherae TaxID=2763006 RepID=UPI001E593D65|nr:XRE family transcriptional regulator [Streptomyces buecherae]